MKPISRIFLIGLFMIVLAGCGSSSTPEPTPEPTPTLEPPPTPQATAIPAPVTRAEQASQQAYIRVIQGSWDLPEVDVYVDGAIYGYNVRFGQVIEPQPLVSGAYTLRLMPAGVDINSHSQETLFSSDFALSAGETLTLIISGDAANLNVQAVPENMTAIDANTSRVTLIHALHGGGELGVKVKDDLLIAPISAGQISHDAPIDDLNSQVQVITPDGEVIAEYGREFRSRTAVTMVMIGDASVAESVRLVYYTTRVYGDSSIFFVNAIADQPSVDIYLDGALVAGGVIYGRVHDELILKPADYQLEILPSGAIYSAPEVIYRALVNLYEDDTSIITLATQNNRINHLVTLNVPSFTPSGQSRIWFVHALYDGRPVDMTIGNISHALYGGDITRERYIDAGNYELVWVYEDGNGRGMPFDVQAGHNYIVLHVVPDAQPLVVDFPIGEEQADLSVDDPVQSGVAIEDQVIAVAEGGALVYVVNLVGGESLIDVSIGGHLIAGVPQGNLILGGRVAPDNYEVRALVSGTQNIFSLAQYSFRDAYFYTIYVTGLNIASPQLYIFEHGLIGELFDEGRAIAQFSNLSIFGSDDFMVAVSDSQVRLSPATDEDGQPLPNRYVVNGDYQVIQNNLRMGQITYPQYLTAGNYELVLFDVLTGHGITTLPNLNLQAGVRYDVIIQQDITTEAISFKVVEYPAP